MTHKKTDMILKLEILNKRLKEARREFFFAIDWYDTVGTLESAIRRLEEEILNSCSC